MISHKHNDEILIEGLELPVRIGVPEIERRDWQVLRADIRLEIYPRFESMQDNLVNTVDYAILTEKVRRVAAERPRQLLETLASELMALLLKDKLVVAAELTLKKRILPGTDFVAVRMHRNKHLDS